MNRRFTAVFSLLVFVFSAATGCIGTNGLGGKVRELNLSAAKSRWGREGLFLLLQPVYGFAAMGDLIYANSVEFWTGKNPINGKPSVTPISRVFQTEDGSTLAMSLRSDGSIDVRIHVSDGEHYFVNLIRTDDSIAARDASGEILNTLPRTELPFAGVYEEGS